MILPQTNVEFCIFMRRGVHHVNRHEDFTANPSKIPEDAVVLRVNYNDPDTDQEEKNLPKSIA